MVAPTDEKPDLSAVKAESVSDAIGMIGDQSIACKLRGILVGTMGLSFTYVGLTTVAPFAAPLLLTAAILGVDAYSNFSTADKLQKSHDALVKSSVRGIKAPSV